LGRAYFGFLISMDTVIEPLRGEWANAQAAALMLANEELNTSRPGGQVSSRGLNIVASTA
jgi:hypothetical protein